MTNVNGRGPQRHPDEQELLRIVECSLALRQLLASAAAPPSAAELSGRSRAVADFLAAHRSESGRLRPASHDPLALEVHCDDLAGKSRSGWLTPRVTSGGRPTTVGAPRFAAVGRWSAARLTVACAALVTVLGGTAAAAAAGELPVPVQNAVAELFDSTPAGHSPAPTATPADRSASPASGAAGSPDSSAASTSRPVGSSAAAGRSAVERASAPQLLGLCRAYRAAGKSRTALAGPGFAPLVAAAKGSAHVDAFCAGLGAEPTAARRAPSKPAVSNHPNPASSLSWSAAPRPAHSVRQPPGSRVNTSHGKPPH